jgi:hypothetical protein
MMIRVEHGGEYDGETYIWCTQCAPDFQVQDAQDCEHNHGLVELPGVFASPYNERHCREPDPGNGVQALLRFLRVHEHGHVKAAGG